MRNFTIFKKNYFSFLVLLQPYNPYGKNGKNGIKTQAWSYSTSISPLIFPF